MPKPTPNEILVHPESPGSRSPNYPSIDLGAAIRSMRTIPDDELRNKMSRLALARYLGYGSAGGRAATKIAQVRAYGLVAGRGQEMQVSDDFITILRAPKKSAEHRQALLRCAFYSHVFRKIKARYPAGLPRRTDVKLWLADTGFKPAAADRLTACYEATLAFVAAEAGDDRLVYENGDPKRDIGLDDPPEHGDPVGVMPAPHGSRQEVISIGEGYVTITFPKTLSLESCEDLAAFLGLFIERAKRRATAQKRN